MERAFIREKLDSNKAPYARFYMTLKAHKLKHGQTVDHLKSRPIVSCPGSLLHGLGIWVDRKLQDVAKNTISCFKNSLELKEQLTQLNLPPNTRLFSADAVSMYTNIPTHTALNLIGKHITQYQQSTNGAYPVDAIRDALRLVMTMNIFTFGDLTLKQLNGTAMGTPPAPSYATIYYGIHEEKFLKKYSHRVIYYRRFIDNVIGIWSPNPNTKTDDIEWNSFQDTMNTFPGLTWEFSECAKTVDFMDMTISITNANKIEITLFEKKMNLHLYIPPHSAHPPGLLPGIVYSTLFRIFTICSSEEDKAKHTKPSSSNSSPVDTKVTEYVASSIRQSLAQDPTLAPPLQKTQITMMSSYTYLSIQMIPHLFVSKRPGESTSPTHNGKCLSSE